MKIIVGLGNPGAEYEPTRHNIGWRVIDAFASKFRIPLEKHEKKAMTGRGRVAGDAVLVAKPLTYMNLSGEAVKLLVNAYAESPAELIVVYDDVDLPVGKIRIRQSGSAGTHNGMRSIVEKLESTAFPRIRLGVRGEEYGSGHLRDYVLDEFTAEEAPAVEAAINRAVDALVLFTRGELRRAMNQFNREPEPVAEKGEQEPDK